MFKFVKKGLTSTKKYIEKYPTIVMSLIFGFGLSYKTLFTHGATNFHLFLIVNSLVSFIFITLLIKYFSKVLNHNGDALIKKMNLKSSFLLFYLTVVSNGLILFLDTANFGVKHGSKYSSLRDKSLGDGHTSIRWAKFSHRGIKEEGMYQALLTSILIILTGIFYFINSVTNSIVLESLFRLSLWSMFWSVIPVAAILGFFTMDLLGRTSKFVDIDLSYLRKGDPVSTGGTIFLVGQRRIWPLFTAFVLFFSMMLLGKISLINAIINSAIVALISFVAWLFFYEFGLKGTPPIK